MTNLNFSEEEKLRCSLAERFFPNLKTTDEKEEDIWKGCSDKQFSNLTADVLTLEPKVISHQKSATKTSDLPSQFKSRPTKTASPNLAPLKKYIQERKKEIEEVSKIKKISKFLLNYCFYFSEMQC
jgi:hypothetical protein